MNKEGFFFLAHNIYGFAISLFFQGIAGPAGPLGPIGPPGLPVSLARVSYYRLMM